MRNVCRDYACIESKIRKTLCKCLLTRKKSKTIVKRVEKRKQKIQRANEFCVHLVHSVWKQSSRIPKLKKSKCEENHREIQIILTRILKKATHTHTNVNKFFIQKEIK